MLNLTVKPWNFATFADNVISCILRTRQWTEQWFITFAFQELKKCFESQDIGMLQTTIEKMDPEQAAYHMKRCVDSGLWVPDAKKAAVEQKAE